jgi:MFS family permease
MDGALILMLSLGCAQIWTNYINRPLPKGGNGYGSPAHGSQATQGALGLGEQIAVRPRSSPVNFQPLLCVSHANLYQTQNATSQSFSLLAYCLPLVVGYLADTRFGRFPMIFWGVIICGVGHILIVAGGAKTLIDNGTAKIPFFIGVYILAIGAGTLQPEYLNPF